LRFLAFMRFVTRQTVAARYALKPVNWRRRSQTFALHDVTMTTEDAKATLENLQSELERSEREHRKSMSSIESWMARQKAELEALELESAILKSRIEAIQNGEAPAKFVAKRVAFARAEV